MIGEAETSSENIDFFYSSMEWTSSCSTIPDCIGLMARFIREWPELWYDIGGPQN